MLWPMFVTDGRCNVLCVKVFTYIGRHVEPSPHRIALSSIRKLEHDRLQCIAVWQISMLQEVEAGAWMRLFNCSCTLGLHREQAESS
jgi:hypothetical protein